MSGIKVEQLCLVFRLPGSPGNVLGGVRELRQECPGAGHPRLKNQKIFRRLESGATIMVFNKNGIRKGSNTGHSVPASARRDKAAGLRS